MERLHQLITKRGNLYPWLITGVVFMTLSLISFCIVPLIIGERQNVVIAFLLLFIQFCIACIPFGVADALEYKIGREIENVFSNRLKKIINNPTIFENMYIFVKRSRDGKYYSLLISSKDISKEKLSNITNTIISDMSKDLPKKLVIKPVIF